MKKIIAILSLLSMTSTVFAQGHISTEKMKKPDYSQKGFYLGLSYINLTDVHAAFTSSGSAGENSGYSESGTHIGLAGVTLGYNRTPEKGFGFSAGAQILEAINRVEFDDEKLNIFLPEVNATFALNRSMLFFAGLNAGVWSGSETAKKFKTQLGGQGGIGIRFNRDLALNAGYTMMNQKYSDDSEGHQQFDADLQYSGFNSTLTYTF